MKNLTLYFLAVLIAVIGLPIAAKKSVANEGVPRITVHYNDSVIELDVEEYVLRVIAGEVGAVEQEETLKSLAVAARSSAVYITLFGCKHAGFDVCDDGDCCFALGDLSSLNEDELKRAENAVDSTRGIALTVDDLPAMALYCGCASSGSVDNSEFGYIVGVGEATPCDTHKTELELQKDEFFELIGCAPDGHYCLVYGESNKCDFAVIDGRVVEGSEFSKLLGLKSSEIIIEEGETVVCRSHGIGHGYGLSLCGAERMANVGLGYEKILEFYFPRLSLNKIYGD